MSFLDAGRRARAATLGLSAIVVVAPAPSSRAAVAERDPRPTGLRACLGETPTIVGTRRADEITGTARRDVIAGGDGDDRIESLAGDDVVCGGRGSDFIRAGRGDDDVAGGRAEDALAGAAGADRIRAGRGWVEALLGGAGDDRLRGGPGMLDSLVGGPGNDLMDGGNGLDTAEFWDSETGVRVDLRARSATGHGEDRLVAIEGVVGSNSDDVIDGDGGSNRLVGQRGDDVIRAYGSGGLTPASGDILSGGPGEDVLDGGEGPDVLDYENSRRPVVVDLAEGTASGDGSDTVAGFEAVIGTDSGDEIAGDAGDNLFAPGEGDDSLDGRGGTDQAAYFNARAPVVVDLSIGTSEGAGSDVLADIEDILGSGGDDSLQGDAEDNVIDGGSGSDQLAGLDGDDTLVGSAGGDAADGGDGRDACEAETEANCEEDPERHDRRHAYAPWG